MTSLVLLSLLVPSLLAQEPAAEPAGFPVMAGEVLVTTLPAAPRAVLQIEEALWVLAADGTLGRWEWASEGVFTKVDERSMPEAVGLFEAGGRPWVELHEVRAVPLVTGPALGAPAVAASAVAIPEVPVASPAVGGEVLSLASGSVVVSLGRGAGLGPGDTLRFLGTEQVEVPSLDGEGTELREVGRVTGTGRVRLVEDERALVDLDRGSRAAVGDDVEILEEAPRYSVAPERLGGLRETGVVVRPLLALDTLGVAFINEAWTSWSFEQPWYVAARVTPLALGWSSEGNPISVSGLVSGGYEARYFSVGLGAGWSMLNGDPGSWGRSYDQSAGEGAWGAVQFEDVDNAFSVVQEARLGSRDGLNLVVRNTFLLMPQQDATWNGSCDGMYYYYEYDEDFDWDSCYDVEDTGSEFEYGGIAMALYVPVGARTDLFTDWGTGGSGVTWVEGGVATWLRGHGDAGSLGISVAAGYGYLQGRPDDQWVDLYGPLVSLGARWRW